jgi:predicted dehydrogenase/threonine dehydrogenase-like Zn-dependent dehydrogenase
MRQILQSFGSGETGLEEAPAPAPRPHHLVVEARASVVSAGTERMMVEFGRANLLAKARKQPDKVREVLAKVRTDGVGPTVDAVRSRLDQPIPLGYCSAGVILDVGRGVTGFREGQRVVTNGPHAEVVRVPWTLAAPIPDGVPFDAAAFTPLAAIALQGLRLARPTLGETVVVYGLGLVGLLAVQVARAAGCRVLGIDRAADRLELGARMGATPVEATPGADPVRAVLEATGDVGADIVLLTVATDSDEPVHNAAAMSRKRGRVVLVGVAGLDLRRDDFFKKELSFQVSCSYGPGRYDPLHEEGGADYPLPYVRWTEARNFSAVLDLMAAGTLDPRPLVSHRFAFSDALKAYDLLTGGEPSLGIVLDYEARGDDSPPPDRTLMLDPRPLGASAGVFGCVGAGSFASRQLIPAFARAGAELHTIASSGGTSAAVAGRAHGFRNATTDVEALMASPDVDSVIVATRHDSHAGLTVQALQAGKHVFVEKPLALVEADVDAVEAALAVSDRLLCVGFNRRFAPATVRARDALQGRAGPLVTLITVNAGAIPADHWSRDPAVGGGRLLGEGVHFLDLARSLAGASIEEVRVLPARGPEGTREDVALVQVGFADGSTASIHYLANGSKRFPKERVELFWDGKILRIDNFRRLKGWGVPLGRGGLVARHQDKGHAALAAAFVDAVRAGGPPPIPHHELLEVSRWAIRAAAEASRARSG